MLAGSLKFTSALHFNDPFEFKFESVAPTREAFDRWHVEKKIRRETSPS